MSLKLKTLITEYRYSVEYHGLSRNTKLIYDRALTHFTGHGTPLNGIERAIENYDVSQITRADILKIRDCLAQTPAIANQFITTVSVLMSFAVDRGYREVNPALRIKRLPVGEWEAWPEKTIAIFLKHLSHRNIILAMNLALETGQRIGDILALTWADFENFTIRVHQQKTGQTLLIPCSRKLLSTLNSYRPVNENPSETIICDGHGNPIPVGTFSKQWRTVVNEKFNISLTFHGLRKTAVKRLVESGCTDREVMAITGHKTTSMDSHYSKQADQLKLARSAIGKLEDYRER